MISHPPSSASPALLFGFAATSHSASARSTRVGRAPVGAKGWRGRRRGATVRASARPRRRLVMNSIDIVTSETHDMFRASVRRFIEREIKPHHAQWEKDGVVSREVWRKAGEAGLLLTNIPAEYG